MSKTVTQQTFDGLAFPIVRVRYAGPTNTRGSRWIATLRRDEERTYRVTRGYDYAAPMGSGGALAAALECWDKARADLNAWSDEHVAIPADLDAGSYAFTFVPKAMLNG